MLNFRTINLEDKPLFDAYVKGRGGACDSFLYWYCWGAEDNILIADDELAVYFLAGSRDRGYYCMIPFLKDEKAVYSDALKRVLEFTGNDKDKFKLWVPEAVKGALESELQNQAELFEDRDGFEYIYKVSDILSLSGHEYRGKRNRIRSFLRRFPNISYKAYKDKYFDSCMQIYEEWRAEKAVSADEDPKETRMRALERSAVVRALKGCIAAGGKGCVIFDSDRPAGFSIAGCCNENSMVSIHFEKCAPEYRDMYAWLFHEFLTREWSGCMYVNREEDLGDQGLRPSKLSWLPCRFNKVYMGRLL